MDDLEYFLKSKGYIEEPVQNKKLRNKAILSFVLCLIADLMSSFDQYAMTHDWIITQVFTGMVSQAMWFSAGLFIYEAKTRRERIILFMSTAVACSLGSTLMLVWFKPFFAKLVF